MATGNNFRSSRQNPQNLCGSSFYVKRGLSEISWQGYVFQRHNSKLHTDPSLSAPNR